MSLSDPQILAIEGAFPVFSQGSEPDVLTGFGVRVYPTGGKVYVAQARGPEGPDKPDKPKRVTLGRHGVIGAEQARRRAALIIVRIKAGEEPVPLPLAVKAVGGSTVADLAARYLEEHVAVRVKPRTAVKARIAVRRQILPALGQVPLVAVERAQVVELQHKMSGTPSAANTAIKTLSHMYRLAAGWGMVVPSIYCIGPPNDGSVFRNGHQIDLAGC